MFSKVKGIVLFFVCLGVVWGEENWRIGVGGFLDLSSESDEVIGTILQSSLEGVLRRDKRFQVMFVSNVMTNLSQARAVGTGAKLDVLIYGFYRREGRDFVVMVKIYDILENDVRLSKIYKGVYSRDIFETVDEIAAAASEEIKRALPALLTEDEIARVQAQRKEIYETKEVTVRREMRIGVGLVGIGAEMEFERWDWGSLGVSYRGHSSLFTPGISLSMQIEGVRVGFGKVGLPWIPNWYNLEPENGELYGEDNINISSGSGVSLAEVLREYFVLRVDGVFALTGNLWFFAGGGGFGGGFSPVPRAGEVQLNDSWGLFIDGGVLSKSWELGLMCQIWPFSQGWRDLGINSDLNWSETSSTGRGYTLVQYNFPLIEVYGVYFFLPQVGATLRVRKADLQKTYEYYPYDGGYVKKFMRVDSVDISLEVTYRFQFGF